MSANFEKIKQAAIKSLEFPGKARHALPKKELAGHSIIYIFRHCQTYDNKRRIFSGRRNSQLTALGIKQAQQLANIFKNKSINLAFTPDLDRCKKTLKIALSKVSGVMTKTTNELLERDYGKLTGQSKLKWMRQKPELTIKYRRAYDFPPPGGESLKMVKKRVFPFCKRLVEMAEKKKTSIAVCGTGNTVKLMRMFFEKLPIIKMLTLESPFADYAAYSIKLKK